MTDITYMKYRDTYILECTGHTDYAPAGEDILCSAVSVLCLTVKDYLEDALDAGDISSLNADIKSGQALIFFTCGEDSRVFEGISALLRGFRLLGESFPDYISFDG